MSGKAGRPSGRTPRAAPAAAPEAEPIGIDAARLARLIGANADIVLVLDRDGVIEDVSIRAPELAAELRGASGWVGRSWIDTVTVESRPKAQALLDAAFAPDDRDAQRRHLNHMVGRPPDVAIEYAMMRLDDSRRAVAFGRDLRPLTALQQRLVDAQATLERDYAELRNTEIRYRMLFDETPEPLFVLDARSARIRETNPAGRRLGGASTLPGANFADSLDPRSRAGFVRFLANVRSDGQSQPMRARLAASRQAPHPHEILLAASLVIEADDELVLMRVGDGGAGDELGDAATDRHFLDAVSQSPDAFVFVDQDACVLGANNTFLEMVGLATIDRVRGRRIDNWLGESGVDFDVLFANLRQRGIVRLFATRLRGERRRVTEVEVSAVSLVGEERPSFGFAIRDVSRRMGSPPASSGDRDVPRSVEQMSELVGRVPLKDLVRDATDVIERLSIEAALELTNDNRANAAEMLGLSRQSLYVKLRRYGIGDLGEPEPT